MNNTTNNQQICDVICKKSCRIQSHERDLYRVCPSKLSKRELENLYFALLDSNRELKKTLHSQQDRLKLLSTKVQRMTVAQRNAAGKEKDCCSSKVLCKEQKEIIADLKTANDQMSERIRLLNMRLCSAKQFLKRSPFQTIKCPRCGICNVAIKNSSASTLDVKPSRENVRMSSASCQYIPAETSEAPKVTQDAETETDQNLNDGAEKQCNENKCRTVMDELKQKILNLQEELSNSHDEYSKRISKLEADVSGLRQENTLVRSGKAASDHALERGERRADDLRGRLRDAEGRVNDLTMQLSIEKHKVKELETSLKLATASNPVAKIIETINTPKAKSSSYVEASGSMSSYYSVKQDTVSPRKCKSDLLSPTSTRLSPTKQKDDAKFSKSDDSGYTDLNKSSEAEDTKISYMERLNQEMLKKISDLQMQVDGFRIKAAGETVKPQTQKSSETGTSDYETQMAVITIAEPDTLVQNRKIDVEIRDLKGETNATTSTPIKESDVVSNSSKVSRSEYEAKPWNDLVRDIDSGSNKTEESRSKLSNIHKTNNESKRDDDNKYQIPGPIPTTSYQSNKDKRRLSKNRSTSKDKTKNNNDLSQRKKSIEEKDVKINDSSENYRSEHKSNEVQAKNDHKSDAIKAASRTESPTKNIEPPKVQSQKLKIVEPKDVNVGNANDSKVNYQKVQNITEDKTVPCADTVCPANDNICESFATLINENNGAVDKNISCQQDNTSAEELSEVKKESSTSYFYRSDTVVTPPQTGSLYSGERRISTQTSKPWNEAEPVKEMEVPPGSSKQDPAPEQQTVPPKVSPSAEPTASAKQQTTPLIVQAEDIKVQTAPQSDVRRDSVYAAISTLRDSATYTETPLRRDSATYTAMPPHRDSATYTAMPPRRESATYTKPECVCERATSPENTERDVSSLSDLPPEKDVKSPHVTPPTSPRDTRSPGEEKATSTYTDTDTRTYDYGPLSDGELPTHATYRPRKLSFGEKLTYTKPFSFPQRNSEAQMEATLNAISEELAHCRKLLAAARDHEVGWDRTS